MKRVTCVSDARNVKMEEACCSDDSSLALSLMKEMNTMTWRIICGVALVVLMTFMVLIEPGPLMEWSVDLLLKILHCVENCSLYPLKEVVITSNVLFFFLGIGSLIVYGGILLKTPSLAQRCGELLKDDSELSARIAKVKPRVRSLWILLTINLVFLLAFLFLVIIFFVVLFLEFLGGFTGTGFTLLALVEGVLFLLFLVSIVANLVIQAFMLIDFFKVKKAIDGMTIQDC